MVKDQKGIDDVCEFYRDRFAFKRCYDFTRNPIDPYDIDHFKALWIFSKVDEGTRVLDFGCGSGRLACLKSKDCRLWGVDFSRAALEIAKEINHYDEVFQGDILQFEPKEPFDYIVSLDVFGHIPFDQKDSLIGRLKNLLRPGGLMLHGIECGTLPYESMTQEEYQKIVLRDGHVGLEDKPSTLARFRKHFQFVAGEVRFDVVAAHSDYLKYEDTHPGALPPALSAYLRGLDPNEARAFNIAGGLTLIKMEEQMYPSSDHTEGFLFLQASDRPLAPKPLWTPRTPPQAPPPEDNLVADDRYFLSGWYPVESAAAGCFRWAAHRCQLLISVPSTNALELKLFTSYPKIDQKPMELYFFNRTTQRMMAEHVLKSTNVQTVRLPLEGGQSVIEIFSDLAWIPCRLGESDDERELSFALQHMSFI